MQAKPRSGMTFLLALLLAASAPPARAQTPAAPPVAAPATGAPGVPASPSEDAGAELARLFEEDQSDRKRAEGKEIDWPAVTARDEARLARVKELLAAGRFSTAADYYHGAMVLQHGAEPEDYLLAHELCVVAIGKGEERAKWLAAASQDRYLMKIGRPQRFGTQYRPEGPDSVWRLYEVDPSVSDEMRKAFNVPPLAVAKEREAAMNERFRPKPKP